MEGLLHIVKVVYLWLDSKLKPGYLVLSSLLLLNVADQRIHKAGHLSHFLSRPLVHWAQIPLDRQTHTLEGVGIQNRKPKLMGWNFNSESSLAFFHFHSVSQHLLKARLFLNLTSLKTECGDTTKSCHHSQNFCVLQSFQIDATR